MVAALAVLAAVLEIIFLIRARVLNRIPRALFFYLVLPLIPALAVWLTAGIELADACPDRAHHRANRANSTLARSHRLSSDRRCARVLLLLTVAVALHFALVGLGLLFFGPEGVRTQSLIDFSAILAGVPVSGESILIVAAAAVFSFLLFLFFEFTIQGRHCTRPRSTAPAPD